MRRLLLPLLASSLLDVACREMGVALTRDQLRAGCAAALQAIHAGGVGGDPGASFSLQRGSP